MSVMRENPAFADDVFAQLHQFSGGVPRIVNTLMERVLLNGALEQGKLIDSEIVGAAIEDIQGEGTTPPDFASEIASGSDGDARIAELETRLEEQEAALRRVLGLLISWLDGGAVVPHNAGKRSDAA